MFKTAVEEIIAIKKELEAEKNKRRKQGSWRSRLWRSARWHVSSVRRQLRKRS